MTDWLGGTREIELIITIIYFDASIIVPTYNLKTKHGKCLIEKQL